MIRYGNGTSRLLIRFCAILIDIRNGLFCHLIHEQRERQRQDQQRGQDAPVRGIDRGVRGAHQQTIYKSLRMERLGVERPRH